MTTDHPIIQDAVPGTWVAIDIAKDSHAVLIEHGGRRERFRLANTVEDFERLITHLRALPQPVRVAFEPTGVYHRPWAIDW